MTVDISGVAFTLLFQKALYKADEELLVIADVHLGKASHFRKNGISLPSLAQQGDYNNLRSLFDLVKPKKVYFLGDLFHSSLNDDWHNFCDLVAAYKHIQFTLVRGNHDLIKDHKFHDICVAVVDTIEDDLFIYSHEPLDSIAAGKVNVVGHIHPGVVLSGMGRQSVKLPCFYMQEQLMILPAFGGLTGLYSVDQSKARHVFLVLSDSVRRL
jgi:DNA ligase-associated metallophosphoesterase